MVRREKSNYLIQSVSHALDVLEELSKAGGEIGVTELSKRLKLHKNNVFRILATLELRGYVDQNPETEDYRLGVKSLELGQSYLTQSSLVARALPIVKTLVQKSGETASFATLQNTTVQFPVSMESKKPVKVSPRVATSIAAKSSSVGQLLLAHQSDVFLEELFAAENAAASLKPKFTELRKAGYIIDKGQAESEVLAISAIVFGVNNTVVGAIEVLAPSFRADAALIAQMVKDAAAELSSALGGATRKNLSGMLEKEVSTSGARA
jgi:DNA-binding IclR family transcriptional regulator